MAATLVALFVALHGISSAAVSVIVGGGGEPRAVPATASSSYALEEERAFEEFIAKHGHEYRRGTVEYEQRRALFMKRLARVKAHNANEKRLWKAGVSRFSDRTEEERKAVRGWRHMPTRRSSFAGGSMLEMGLHQPDAELPKHVSWKHLSAANNIRDQGACGSCWAITTTSVLEAHYELYVANKSDDAPMFSTQQVMDCTPNPHECGGQGGCQGATVELGMAWVLQNGVATEDKVPYSAEDSKCHVGGGHHADSGGDQSTGHTFQVLSRSPTTTHGGAAIGLHGYQTLESNTALPLRRAVAQYGPVAVSAAAGDWFEYQEGIFDGCSKDAVVDHAITLYGYGVEQDSGKKYWLIRNSWGREWGEQGYIRLLRHDDDEDYCGTDNDPSQGTGCKGGPDHVPVCGMCGILYDSVVPYFNAHKRGDGTEHGDPVPEAMRSAATKATPPSGHHARGPEQPDDDFAGEMVNNGDMWPDEEQRAGGLAALHGDVHHHAASAALLRRELTISADAMPTPMAHHDH